MSCIVGPKQIEALLIRYNGIGKPITSDEREILLFALYNESEQREGVAKTARAACDRIWKRQQIVGAEEPVVAQSATPGPAPQHCGCPVGAPHTPECPTVLGDIARTREGRP